MWGGDSIWGEILSGVKFHVGWSSMWVEFYMGWNSMWGGMSKILILYEFFQFSEMAAKKRIAPLNSSIPDGSESLTMLGSFSAPPWSCIKSRNSAGDGRTLNVEQVRCRF